MRVRIFLVFLLISSFVFPLILKSGDMIAVEIYTYKGLVLEKTLSIDEEGFVPLPFVGRIKADGRDLDYLREKLEKTISDIYSSATVVMYVKKPAREMVYFHGAVTGVVDLSTVQDRSLAAVLSFLSTGNNLSKADLSAIRVIRGRDVIRVNLERFLETGDADYNLLLRKGDVVNVPLKGSVGIFGGVEKPGFFAYRSDLDLLDLVSEAGGFTDNADLKNVAVFRSGSKFEINAEDLMKNGEDFPLESGDVIYVPEYEKKVVYVRGYVKHPGAVVFIGEEPTLIKAIVRSGGFVSRENVERIKVISDKGVEILAPSSDTVLSGGEVVDVVEREKVEVYVSGVVSKVVEFSRDRKPSLKKLLSKIGFSLSGDVEYEFLISRAGESVYRFRVRYPEDVPDVHLEDGDTVFVVRTENVKVYVSGMIRKPGVVEFRPFEMPRLKELLYRVSPTVEEGKVYLTRDGKTVMYDLKDVMKGSKDVELKDRDFVYVDMGYRGVVHIMGAGPGEVHLLKDVEKLSDVLKRLSLPDVSNLGKVILIKSDGRVFEYDFSDLIRKRVDGDVENGDLILVKRTKIRSVYVVGDVSAVVEFRPDETMNEKVLISKLGLSIEEIEKLEGDIEDGRVVEVRLKKPTVVFVEGEVERPGFVEFEPRARPTLREALSRAGLAIKRGFVRLKRESAEDVFPLESVISGEFDVKLKSGYLITVEDTGKVYLSGGIRREVRLSEAKSLKDLLKRFGPTDLSGLKSVVLLRGDKTFEFDVNEILNNSTDTILKNGDFVIFKSGKLFVYVTGDLSRVLEFSSGESPSPETILAKLAIPRDSVESIEGNFEYGGVVRIKLKKGMRIYVMGDSLKKGQIVLDPDEKKDLRTLLGKLGLESSGYRVELNRRGKIFVFDSERILNGVDGMKLEDGDLIRIEHGFGKVWVFGSKISQLVLERSSEKLSDVIKRLGISDLDTVSEVRLVGNGKNISVDIHEVLSGERNPSVEDGDLVILERAGIRRVYVVGDISRVISFEPGETMNVDTLISKLGVPRERVDRIEGEVENGSVVKLRLKSSVKIYVVGEGSLLSNGVVLFEPDEDPTLRNMVSKLNLRLEENVCLEVFRKGEKVFDSDIKTAISSDFRLMDGDFVKLKIDSVIVYVFGESVRQGVYVLKGKNTLKDLVAEMGGLNPRVGSVKIYRSGRTREYSLSPDNIPEVEIKSGDTLIFGEMEEPFVYVLGDVRSPGPVFVGRDSVKLVKVLALAGGLDEWGKRSEVLVERKDERLKVDLSDPEKVVEFFVKAGDIVFVPSVESARAYVLGAVLKPGVVPIEKSSTLVDVIMRVGGFSKKAVRDRVYIFRGGVKGPVEVHDMSWIETGRIGEDPRIGPGDIVFVPDDPMMKITDIVSFINTVLSFINNSIGTYRNVQELMGR